MRKKALSLLLAIIFILALVPVAAASPASYTEVVSPKYDEVLPFSEGLAAVRIGDNQTGKWGFIDKTGAEVIPPRYDSAISFSEGLAAVRVGDWQTGKWGYIDKSGNEVVTPRYEAAARFHEGLAAVRIGDSQTGKWGYINTSGNEVVSPRYDGVESYFWGEASGYNNVGLFSEGLAAVMLNGKWGFIDKSGNEVIPLDYDSAGAFSEGFAAVQLDGKWGYINTSGNLIVPLKYDNVFLPDAQTVGRAGPFSEGLAAVQLDGKWGYIDTSGNEVIPLIYDVAFPFSEGLASVNTGGFRLDMWPSLNGKSGFIDKSGNVIVPLIYDAAGSFSNGYAAVYMNNPNHYATWNLYLAGIIDKSGNEIVPPKYHSLGQFSEGFALFVLGEDNATSKRGFIDESGNEVVPPIYDFAGSFSEGLAAVMVGDWQTGKWGFISITAATPSPAPDAPDSWAAAHVNAAIEANILPQNLQSAYRQATTRAEFATLAVALYEAVTGDVIETEGNPFTDTNDINAIKAASIGVTRGTTSTTFSPNRVLTREEAATMLSRLANAVGKPLAQQAATYTDNDRIASYALDAVGQLQAAGIMEGVGSNTFSPKGSYERQQSIVTIMRLYDFVS